MKTTRTFFTTLLLVCGAAASAGDAIPAQPIGLIDKDWAKNTEQSDFYEVVGKSHGLAVKKLVFSAKVKDIPNKGTEQRALFVQDIESTDFVTTFFRVSDSKLKKIGTYTLPVGSKFDSFLTTDDGGQSQQSGDVPKVRYHQMFFHVPGRGLLVSEGGNTPKVVRAENKNDPTTAIVAGAIRLRTYASNNSDPELQGRLFFTAKDPKKGREPFIYGGTAAKVLKDINPLAKTGSDPDQFAALGPQNESQRMFFVAKNPNDSGNYNLWVATITINAKHQPIYDAAPFATSATIPGKPEHLIANGSDLFFTAPSTVGGTPVLWHMDSTATQPSDLEYFPGAVDPQQLTFTTKDQSYSELAFTVNDGGTRRYARWSHLADSVTILLNTGTGVNDPGLITDAGQYFYFAADYSGDVDPATYLYKHFPGDNSIDFIANNSGNAYPYNIREICAVTSDGTAGELYFTCDYYNGSTAFQNVLMKRPANDTSTGCSFVLTPQNNIVIGAKNLRAVVNNGSPGVFRLYFCAPVNSTTNAEFIPLNSTITDFGTKPWVTEEQN